MKKIIAILMALVMLVPAYTEAANSQLEKARKKELKTKLKEYKKGKWEILGSRTLEYSLAKHYDRLNELEPSYTIIRTNPDGSYEIRSYFIVAESAASKARQRALEAAMKDSEAAQKHSEKISGFVKESFQD